MKDIQVFDFEDNAVRVVDIDGEPWFVAADVCRVLDIKNPSDTINKRLDSDERGIEIIYTPSGDQEMLVVNESGLYNLIFRSTKPEAKKFRKWVTAEVLPSIRKTGMYVAPDAEAQAADEVRGGDRFGELPDRTFQQWINLVRETRLLFGRAAARSVWESSPLPTPRCVPNAVCPEDDGEFSQEDGKKCLDIIVSACFDGGAVKRGCGVRSYVMYGRTYLFVAMSHPFIRKLFARSVFENGKHVKALLTLPESTRPHGAVRVGSWQGRGVLVPYPEAAQAA